LFDVSVCALSETQNVGLTTERRQKPKSRETKEDRSIRLEINKTKLLRNTEQAYRNFKRGTEIPERKLRPLVGPLLYLNIFLSSPSRNKLDISKDIGLWAISVPK